MDAPGSLDMHFHMVQVRNTFLEVQTQEDVERKSTSSRPRSKSWTGSSSSNSCNENSSADAEKEQWYAVTTSGQAHHSVFEENSSSASSALESVSTSWENALHEFNNSAAPTTRRLQPPLPPAPAPKDNAQAAQAVQSRIEAIEEFLEEDYQPQYGQSIGAKGHGRGKCTPCTRILVRPGCDFGARCMFCHLEHSHHTDSKKNRHRPCKAARQQYKQTIQKVYEEYKDNPERKKKALEKIAETSPYMRSLLKGLGEKDEDEVLARLGQAVEEELSAPRVPGLQPPGEVPLSSASAASASASSASPTPKSQGGKSLISL
ncbi:unnamed protein product [Symbiodinium natans]|uniref:C3H1-type domain-containing protein n=1 Tax=Symbiodinium natans TaxID=878477 RepID=A0A812T2Q6_9DINO|nr:unnamed protein product [Symbiodinium natans]